MRIQLTEEQYSRLVEQMIGVSDYSPTSGKPMPNYGENLKKATSGVTKDDLVDYTSAGLDGIPGLGNLASFGVDTVHALSYMYRYIKTTNEQEKIEYGIMGLLTLVTAFIPVGGNIINVASRGGLKTFVRRTPEEVLHLLKRLGLYNKKIWPFQKLPWSFNVGLFLFKVTRGEMEEYLVDIYNKLNELKKKLQKTPLEKSIIEFQNMINDIQRNGEIYGKSVKYV
jgi:hypothetical protein